jgi:hypothetical protein
MADRYTYENPADVKILLADERRTTAGATGPRIATSSSGRWVAHSVVLNPR